MPSFGDNTFVATSAANRFAEQSVVHSSKPVAPVVLWLTSNTTTVGVRGSNLGVEIFIF